MSVNASLMRGDFQEQLAFGQLAETLIAKWLRAKGNAILPIYDKEVESGKGPRLFFGRFQAAAPDLLVWGDGQTYWCETKRKTVFSWYRKKSCWVTGIDRNHWRQYQEVCERTGLAMYLMFLHESAEPDAIDRRWNCPSECPVGLFAGSLGHLRTNVSHESDRHGWHGMIYWAESNLTKVAGLDEVYRLARSDQ